MKLLVPVEMLAHYRSRDMVPLECEFCGAHFKAERKRIDRTLRGLDNRNRFCSVKCQNANMTHRLKLQCEHCGGIFEKKRCEHTSRTHHFCSASCANEYRERNRVTGRERSRIVRYARALIEKAVPGIEVKYHDRSLIPSRNEIDMVFPIQRLAVELVPARIPEIWGEDAHERLRRKTERNNAELTAIGYRRWVITYSGSWREDREQIESFIEQALLSPFREL